MRNKSNRNYRFGVSMVSIVKMTTSIKFFHFFQKCHKIIGIYPCQSIPKQHSINPIQIIFLICAFLHILVIVAYLVFEAKSIFDYGFAFFSLIAVVDIVFVYLILIWQLQNTLQFIRNCEDFIVNKSTYYSEHFFILKKKEKKMK